MAAKVSVVIPSLNEEARLAAAVGSALEAGAAEVIVADGGSSDETVARAALAGARVLTGERMRARQMNAGAEAASGEIVIFLHADTRLPEAACRAVEQALATGAAFGGFRISFEEPSLRLRVAAAMINARTAVTRCPWGDQAQFILRETFLRMGGYPSIPIMEDYELAVRMKRSGPTVVLPDRVVTSGRRFLAKGVFATAFTNWRIVAAYRRGVDPAELAEIYRRTAGRA